MASPAPGRAEADDLRRDTMSVARRQQQAIAHRHVPAQPVDIDDEAGQARYAPFQARQSDVAQPGRHAALRSTRVVHLIEQLSLRN